MLAGERTVAAAARALSSSASTESGRGERARPDGVVAPPVVRALPHHAPARRRRASAASSSAARTSSSFSARPTGERAAHSRAAPRHDRRRAGGREVDARPRALGGARDGGASARQTYRGCLAYGDGITYWPLGEILREHYGLREGASARRESRPARGSRDPRACPRARRRSAIFTRSMRASACTRRPSSFVEELASEPARRSLRHRGHPLGRARPARPARAARHRCRGAGDARCDRAAGARRLSADAGAPGSATRPSSGSIRCPAAAASRLLEEMLPRFCPDDLRDLLVERADGNPFFLEELVGELVDSGVLVAVEKTAGRSGARDCRLRDAGHRARGSRGADRPAPGAGEGGASGRRGRRPRVLGRLRSSISSDGAEPDFALLEERDLVANRASHDRRAIASTSIKHALTREVAYGSIPKAQRGRLHASLRGLARAQLSWGRTSARRCSRTTTRRRSNPRGRRSRLGRRARRACIGSAHGPCTGFAAPASSRGGGTRWTRRSSSSRRAVELTDDDARAGAALAPPSVRRTRSGTTARGCRRRSLRALDGPLDDAERPTRTRSSRSSRRSARRCGRSA